MLTFGGTHHNQICSATLHLADKMYCDDDNGESTPV